MDYSRISLNRKAAGALLVVVATVLVLAVWADTVPRATPNSAKSPVGVSNAGFSLLEPEPVAAIGLPQMQPTLTIIATVSGTCRDLAVSGSYVLAGIDDALKVFNVTNPAQPQEVASHTVQGDVLTVSVDGTRAYVVDSGLNLRIYDIGSLPTLTQIGTALVPLVPLAMEVHSGKVYLGEDPAPGVQSGLRVIDVSNEQAITEVGVQTFNNNSVNGLAFFGQYLLAALWKDGRSGEVVALDVSSPSLIVLAGSLPTDAAASAVHVKDSQAYITTANWNRNLNELMVYDLSNLWDPHILGEYYYPIDSDTKEAATPYTVATTSIGILTGEVAYVKETVSGPDSGISHFMRYLDTATSPNPASRATVQLPQRIMNMVVSGDYVFTADGRGGFITVRVDH